MGQVEAPGRILRLTRPASRVFTGSPTSARRLWLAGARHLLNMFLLEQGPGLAQSWGSGNLETKGSLPPCPEECPGWR